MTVSVENVSDRTVLAYSLRYSFHNGEARSEGTLHPNPDQQTLRPGESRLETIRQPLLLDNSATGSQLRADFVYFGDGTTWGPSQVYARDFIRE